MLAAGGANDCAFVGSRGRSVGADTDSADVAGIPGVAGAEGNRGSGMRVADKVIVRRMTDVGCLVTKGACADSGLFAELTVRVRGGSVDAVRVE